MGQSVDLSRCNLSQNKQMMIHRRNLYLNNAPSGQPLTNLCPRAASTCPRRGYPITDSIMTSLREYYARKVGVDFQNNFSLGGVTPFNRIYTVACPRW